MKHCSDIAVLFVHGIQGSPRQFRFLEETLPKEVETRNLLLPGHGGSVRAFCRSGAKEWLECVEWEVLSLINRGKRIIYVGHSMGCLLGLLTAQKETISFAQMLLLCCPFYLRLTKRYFDHFIWALISKKKTDDPFIQASRAANSIHARWAAGYLGCIPPYLELFRVIRQSRKMELSHFNHIIFYYSELDEIVSPRSQQTAQQFTSERIHVLPGCGHNYLTDRGRRILQDRLRKMVNEASRAAE